MKLISHRGNIDGPQSIFENTRDYILDAIDQGYEVEIDLRARDGWLWLGHDDAYEKTSLEFLSEYQSKLWIHCKNMEALAHLNSMDVYTNLNYFWHDNDQYTITSRGWIWAYPHSPILPDTRSIAVLPEIHNTDTTNFAGICSDNIGNYK